MTALGRKAARLSGHQSYVYALWMLGPERLVDQVLLAFVPPFPRSLEEIDSACCCTATADVVALLGAPPTRTLVELIDVEPSKYKLTVEGEGRAIAVRAELEAAWKEEIQSRFSASSNAMAEPYPDPKSVFVIHGRNESARMAMSIFLRACGLTPINFGELRSEMGGTPTIADIVEEGMRRAQGIVALFTPDEHSVLRPEHRKDRDEPDAIARWQARPNVIFEAGMAFGKDRTRVVFVVLGDTKLFTDVAGVHVLRPTNDANGDRGLLRDILRRSLKCAVENSRDWMRAGDFEGCVADRQGPDPRGPIVPTHVTDASREPIEPPKVAHSNSTRTDSTARIVPRPNEFEHPYFLSSLTLHAKDSDKAGTIHHVEHYCKLRLGSQALRRSAFLPGAEGDFLQRVRAAYPKDHNIELDDPDPGRVIAFNTDADRQYYRCWSWTSSGVLGMGTSLPMLLAPDRYSVADILGDMVRFLGLASELAAMSDSVLWFELVATGLKYQLEGAELFQTSRLGTPHAYKPGIGSECIVERYLDSGGLRNTQIATVASEIMQLALAKVHKERIEPEVLLSIAQQQLAGA